MVICLAIYGVPLEFCLLEIKSQLIHGMIKDEKRMCHKGLQDFQYVGEGMSDINVFFKNQRDCCLHMDAHQKLIFNIITGYKDHVRF